jgi:hypothetical protein
VLLTHILFGRLLFDLRLGRLLTSLFNFLDRLWVNIIGHIRRIEVFQPVTDLFLRREFKEVFKSIPFVKCGVDRLIRIMLLDLSFIRLPLARPGALSAVMRRLDALVVALSLARRRVDLRHPVRILTGRGQAAPEAGRRARDRALAEPVHPGVDRAVRRVL